MANSKVKSVFITEADKTDDVLNSGRTTGQEESDLKDYRKIGKGCAQTHHNRIQPADNTGTNSALLEIKDVHVLKGHPLSLYS